MYFGEKSGLPSSRNLLQTVTETPYTIRSREDSSLFGKVIYFQRDPTKYMVQGVDFS